MPRPTPIALTEAEKRDLVTLIQQGQALPEKYRFVLFEDKREVELVWNGKTRDVCTTVLPFQSLEHVDEPRKEAKASPQSELFDPRGRQVKGWTNKLILSSLKEGALRQQTEDAGGAAALRRAHSLARRHRARAQPASLRCLSRRGAGCDGMRTACFARCACRHQRRWSKVARSLWARDLAGARHQSLRADIR